MKFFNAIYNQFKNINRTDLDILFIASTFMLAALFYHNPLKNVDLLIWTGAIGPATIDGISIGKRVCNFYLLFLLIIPLSFVACFSLFNYLLKNRLFYRKVFLNFSSIVIITVCASYFTNSRSSSINLIFLMFYVELVGLRFIDKFQKLNFEDLTLIIVRTISISITIVFTFLVKFKIGLITAIFIILVYEYIKNNILRCANNAQKYKQVEIWNLFDGFLNLLVFFPFIFRVHLEICYFLIAREIIIIQNLFYVVLCCSISIIVLLFLFLFSKKVILKSNAVYIGSILSVGAISLISSNYNFVWSYLNTANLYELGNQAVVTDSLERFKLPIIDYFSAHAMSDVIAPLIYSLIFADNLGFLVNPYQGIITLLGLLILYKLLSQVLNSKHFAILFVLFLPVLFSNIKIVSLCFISVLAYCKVIKDKSVKSFIIYFTSLLFSSFYLYDEGIALSLGSLISLLIILLIKHDYKNLKKAIFTGISITVLFVLLLLVYAYFSELKLFSRIQEWKSVSLDSSSVWATSSFGDPSTFAFVFTYYISPFSAILMLLYAIKELYISKCKKNEICITNGLLILFCIAQIIFIPRTIVFHNLTVTQARSSVTLNFFVWSMSLFILHVLKEEYFLIKKVGSNKETKLYLYQECLQRGFIFAFSSMIILVGICASGLFPKDDSYLLSKIDNVSKLITIKDIEISQNNIINNHKSRIIFDDDSEKLINKFKIIFETLLTKNQTFIDFANLTSLYAITNRIRPSYVGQTPSLLTDLKSQQEYLKQIQKFDCPITVIGNSKSNYLSQMLGIPHNVRYFTVAEYIYTYYRPLVSFDEYVIWCKKELRDEYLQKLSRINLKKFDYRIIDYGYDFVSTDTFNQMVADSTKQNGYNTLFHIYNVNKLPYLQGSFDKVNINNVEQLKIGDFKLSNGKYLFKGSKSFGLNKVGILTLKAKSDTNSSCQLKLSSSTNVKASYVYNFACKKGSFTYTFRVSQDYLWHAFNIDTIFINSNIKIQDISLFSLE